MTILQMTNAYGPRTGGVRTHIDQVRPLYAAQGIRAALLVPGERSNAAEDAYGPVLTVAAPVLPINRDYRNIVSGAAVAAAVAHLQPDAIEVLDKWTLPRLAPRLAAPGRSVLGFSCERLDQVLPAYLGHSQPVLRGIAAYNRWFCRQFTTVVCHSRYSAAELRGAGADNVVTVPLGVAGEHLGLGLPDEAWRRELLGDGRALLVYVGRLVAEKNVRLLSAMMAHLAPEGYRLAVVGAGPESEERRLRAAPGTRLLGFVRDRERLQALLASCDVFVFPSAIEAFALSVLEALASGCRIAAVAGGAVPEILPPGAGVLARGEAAALAEAVRRAMALPRSAAAAAGRRTAGQLTWGRYVDRILALHQESM